MRIRGFDVAGIAAVGFFLGVVATDLNALRRPTGETALAISADDLEGGFREGVSWYGFYLRETKIGFSRIDRQRAGSTSTIRVHSLFRPTVLGRTTEVEMHLDATFDLRMELRRIDLELRSGASHFTANAKVEEDQIDLELVGGGLEHRTHLPIDEPPALDLTVRPALLAADPEIGRRYSYRTFDPMTLGVTTTEIEYQGRDTIEILGEKVNAHLLLQASTEHPVRAWVNDLGEVLKEEMPLGILAIRETEADATWGLGKGAPAATAELGDAGKLLSLIAPLAARPAGGGLRGGATSATPTTPESQPQPGDER